MQELDLSNMYRQLRRGQHMYRLCSMFCYYGRHYMAIVLMPDGTWSTFDDAMMTQVGLWADVINKSVSGKLQPAVLFYQKLQCAHP